MFYLQCITRIQLLSNIMLQQPSLTSNNSVTSFILCLSGKLRIYMIGYYNSSCFKKCLELRILITHVYV